VLLLLLRGRRVDPAAPTAGPAEEVADGGAVVVVMLGVLSPAREWSHGTVHGRGRDLVRCEPAAMSARSRVVLPISDRLASAGELA
jgi:hypothetical protein